MSSFSIIRDPCVDVAILAYTIIERSEIFPPTRTTSSFPDVIASLFDDEETSNVVFAISDPRRSTRHDEYIYAHTKILAIRSEYFKTSKIISNQMCTSPQL